MYICTTNKHLSMQKDMKYRILLTDSYGERDFDCSVDVPFFPILPVGSSYHFSDKTRVDLHLMIYNSDKIKDFSDIIYYGYSGPVSGDRTCSIHESCSFDDSFFNNEASLDDYKLNITDPSLPYCRSCRKAHIDVSDYWEISDYVYQEKINTLFVVISGQ